MSTRSWIRRLFVHTPRTIRRNQARFRPGLETLEDRVTPSTYYVINSNDDLNPGSLRWAITQANANPGPDTIDTIEKQGSISVPHDINLTLNGTQLPDITGDLTIIGHPGSGFTTGRLNVSGNNLSRVFSISQGASVQLSGLTITNGNAKASILGGGISNNGTLTINGCTISNNDATSGGGILNANILSIINSTVSDNQADDGGGIFNLGTLSITGSTISGNRAGVRAGVDVVEQVSNGDARGGGIYSILGTITLDHVTLEGNMAQGGDRTQGNNGYAAKGGGLYVSAGSVTIVDSSIQSNTARGGNGGVGATGTAGTPPTITSSSGSPGGPGGDGGAGGAGAEGSGGGVYTAGGQVSLFRTTVSGNAALGGAGGAGGVGGAGATGGNGRDAISGTGGDITHPAFPGGRGGDGGRGGAGGAGGASSGGGLYFQGSTLNLRNSTVADNEATSGDGGAGGLGGNGGAGGLGGSGVGAVASSNGANGGAGGNGGVGGQGGASGTSSGGGLVRAGGSVLGGDATIADNQAVAGGGGAGGAGGAAGPGGLGGIGVGQSSSNGAVGPNGVAGSSGVRGTAGAAAGGGIAAGSGAVAPNNVLLDNTLVALNLAAGAPSDVSGNIDLFSAYNLVGTGGAGGLTNGINGNLIGIADPGLGTLGNNGGPTQTIALVRGSPAINAGINGLAWDQLLQPLTTDQRGIGFPRIVGPSVDIGAFESIYGAESLVVTTLSDEYDGTSNPAVGTGTSLREAIDWANVHPGDDTISFATGLAGTITLGGTELPIVTDDLTITGPGADKLTIDGNNASRILEVAAGGSLALSGVAISHGQAANGGGISSAGPLTVQDSAFSANSASGDGGAIFSDFSLQVSGSSFSGNSSTNHGGAIHNDHGKATVTDSTLSNNSSLIGGAIHNFDELEISGSQFSINFTGAFGSSIGNGGTLTVTTSTFSGSTGRAADGGGIYNGGTAKVTSSTFSNNSVTRGSGIFNNINGSLTVSGSTFSGNSGSALYNDAGGSATVANSTFSGNTGTGAGIRNAGTLTVTGSTLSGNKSSSVSGAGGIQSTGTLTLTNTIVAGNIAGSSSTPRDLVGTASSDSAYNLIGSASSAGGLVDGVSGNIVGVDPKLGPLADNGGPTKTMALLPFSPALNAGSNALIPVGLTTDQRGSGFSRIRGGTVDIGAFEVQDNRPTISSNNSAASGDEGSPIVIPNRFGGYGASGLFDDDGGIGNVTLSASVGTMSRNDFLGSWYWYYTPTDSGSTTVIITATDSYGMKATVSFPLTVNNVPPTASITGAPGSGHSPEGTTITLGSSVSDPSPDDMAAGFTYAWNVTKNGAAFASGSTAGFSFTPDDDGSYVVTLTATDKDGGISPATNTTIIVDNVAPVASITGIPASGRSPEGTAITLGSLATDASSADSAAGFTYAWNVTRNGAAFASGSTAGFSFTPDDDGSYVVTLTATDKDGGISPATSTTIIVDNVAPVASITGIPASGRSPEGTAITLGSLATDPSSADSATGFTYAWSATKNGSAYGASSDADFSFTPDDDGSFEVTLTATDKDGAASLVASTTIVVDNVAPSISVSGANSVNAGATYTLTLGAVSDPGTDTVSKYVVNWGDGKSDTYTSGGAKAHVYTTGGVSRAITVDLVDEDGTYTNRANSLDVTVNTVIAPPTVTVPPVQTANEDVDKAITGITVASGNGGTLMVTLTVAHGNLTLGTTSGLTVTGNTSGTVKLTGNAAALNLSLASLIYRGDSNYAGADTLLVTVSEGSLNANGSVAITVKSAAQQAADLKAQVANLESAGMLTSAQIAVLSNSLNLKNNKSDVARVGVFLLAVEIYRLTGVLTQAQADALLVAGNTLLLSVMRR